MSIDQATTVEDFKIIFHQQEAVNLNLQNLLASLRADTDTAVARLNQENQKLRVDLTQGQMEKMDLIDVKLISPTNFDGSKLDAFKPWAKRLVAFCNAKSIGFRAALKAAERAGAEINDQNLTHLGWEPAADANRKLYDLLNLVCTGEALTIFEKTPTMASKPGAS